MLSQSKLVLNHIGCELVGLDLNFELVEPFDEHILMRFEDRGRYESVDSQLFYDLEQIDFCVQFGASLDKQLVVDGLGVSTTVATAFKTAATAQNREASPVIHDVVFKWLAPEQVAFKDVFAVFTFGLGCIFNWFTIVIQLVDTVENFHHFVVNTEVR